MKFHKLVILTLLIIMEASIFFSCKFQNQNESKKSSQEIREEINNFSKAIIMDDNILLIDTNELNPSINSISIFSINGSNIKAIKGIQNDLAKIDISFLKKGKYEVIVNTTDGSQFKKYIEIEK